MASQRFSRKILNVCIVGIIIVAIVFTALMFILNYDVKGETNMPFLISKINIISTIDGQDVENSEYKWSINAVQNNDIYLYIEKNSDYKKQETISYVKIENIQIKHKPKIGEVKIYKPVETEATLFKNIDENIANDITFNGAKATNSRALEISNQGGPVVFRCANNNVGNYLSNDDEEIHFENILKKLNINEEDILSTISFNITIALNSGKVFRAENVDVKIPNENIVEEGRCGLEITDLQNIIFKRIEN